MSDKVKLEPPKEQVVAKVHRTPTQCILDVARPGIVMPLTSTSELKSWQTLDTSKDGNFAAAVPFPFWIRVERKEEDKTEEEEYDHIRVDFSFAGQVLGKEGDRNRECQVNLQARSDTNQSLTASVKSFTPMLGVGRETNLSPGKMMTFILTPQGKIETRLFDSDRPEVLATKFQTLPEEVDDDWENSDFFDKPPPPQLTRWEKTRRWYLNEWFPSDEAQERLDKIEETAANHRRKIWFTVILILLTIVGGVFWARRRK